MIKDFNFQSSRDTFNINPAYMNGFGTVAIVVLHLANSMYAIADAIRETKKA